MGINAGDVVSADQLSSWINDNYKKRIENSIVWHSGNLPDNAPDSLKKSVRGNKIASFSIGAGGFVSVSGFYAAVQAVANDWNHVFRVRVIGQVGNNTNGGNVTYRTVFDDTQMTNMNIAVGDIMYRGGIEQNDPIKSGPIARVFDQIYKKWQSLPVKTFTWGSCHQNCHNSCHGSGGWR